MLKLHVDHRLGGTPRYYLASQEDPPVYIPERIRKSVVFLCYRNKKDEVRYAGTAFFVNDALDRQTGFDFTLLVTAHHVILHIAEESRDQKVIIEINNRESNVTPIETNVSQWEPHKGKRPNDVAVLHLFPSHELFEWYSTPLSMAVTDEQIEKEIIGIGNEVFVVGLFKGFHGNLRNQPIIRTGNIAMLPDELIPTEKFGDLKLYLVEGRSTGGLSGSPVYVYQDGMRMPRREGGQVSIWSGQEIYWLGLIHGHYDVSLPTMGSSVSDSKNSDTVNMGVAMVVPASKVLETISQPGVQEMKKRWKRERLSESEIKQSLDSNGDESQITEEEFFDALDRVIKPDSPSDQEKS